MGRGPAEITLAILLLLAGCSGIFAGPDATPTPVPTLSETGTRATPTLGPPTTSGVSIQIDREEFPVNPALVWRRVQSLYGTGVEPPERILVSEPEPVRRVYPRFYRRLTTCEGQDFNRSAGGSVRSPDTVHLFVSANTSAASIEAILAHEYAHVIQFRTNATRNVSFDNGGALLQGGAIYVEDRYIDRYLNDTGVTATTGLTRFQRAAPCERVAFSQNYFGYRYIAHRIDTPRNLDKVYANPPKTTEELIHNLSPGTEPPLPLDPEVEVSAGSEWLLVGNATLGELTVRSILWTQLDDSRVDVAASGWGNDRLLTFWNGTEYGYVWVLRWDGSTHATEFQEALERFLDARANPTQRGWSSDTAEFRMQRVGPDTVILIAGESGFQRTVNVTEDGTTVSVAIG